MFVVLSIAHHFCTELGKNTINEKMRTVRSRILQGPGKFFCRFRIQIRKRAFLILKTLLAYNDPAYCVHVNPLLCMQEGVKLSDSAVQQLKAIAGPNDYLR